MTEKEVLHGEGPVQIVKIKILYIDPCTLTKEIASRVSQVSRQAPWFLIQVASMTSSFIVWTGSAR